MGHMNNKYLKTQKSAGRERSEIESRIQIAYIKQFSACTKIEQKSLPEWSDGKRVSCTEKEDKRHNKQATGWCLWFDEKGKG